MRNKLLKMGVFAMLIFLLSSCAADIRTDFIKKNGIEEAQAIKGKVLLEQAAQAHGADAWAKYDTWQVTMRDEWRGLPTKLLGRPWNKDDLLEFRFIIDSFNARVDFIDGDRKGEVWGIQAWETYKKKPDESELKWKDDGDVRFFLAAFQYFLEFPFRIGNAEIISYAGEEIVDGQLYDAVFATWNKSEPHKENDQYLVFINKSTRLIDRIQFTVRDQFKFATSAIHFQNIRDVEGVKLPYTVTITGKNTMPEPSKKNYYHEMRIEDYAFDTFERAELLLKPELQYIGDAKVD